MVRVLIGIVIGMLVSAAIGSAQQPTFLGVLLTGREYAGFSSNSRLMHATGIMTGMTVANIVGQAQTKHFVDCLTTRKSTGGILQHVFDDYVEAHPQEIDQSMTVVAGLALSQTCP